MDTITYAKLAHLGSDGVKLWNLKNGTQLQERLPDYNCAQRGPVTCTLWVTRRNDKHEMLVFGTLMGYIVVWSQTSQVTTLRMTWVYRTDQLLQSEFNELADYRIGIGSQITCITDDQSGSDNRRLAIGARDKRIMVVELDSNGSMFHIFSVTMDRSVPSGLAFADHEDCNLYVFGHYDGDVYVLLAYSYCQLIVDCSHLLRGSDGRVLSSRNIGTPM